MKKNTAIFLVLVSILCFFGCDKQNTSSADGSFNTPDNVTHEPYTSLIADCTNDEYSIPVEIDFWQGIYFEKQNMPDTSYTVLENSYCGSYRTSINKKWRSYTMDLYTDKSNVEFGLRADTGKLVFLNLMNSAFFDTQPFLPDVDNPAETALSLAKEIAETFVDNVDNYTQIIEEPRIGYAERDGVTHKITYHVITFAKKINGYFSSDFIAVKVTSKGTLATITMGDINAFADTSVAFDTQAAEQSIAQKIEASYKNIGFSVKQTTLDYQRIAITPDGDICLYSCFDVSGTDISGKDAETATFILTILGKK